MKNNTITNISIKRCLNTRPNKVQGTKNYPTWRVFATRDTEDGKVTIRRRFGYKKFGGSAEARAAAQEYASHLSDCSDYQFINAGRPMGRPFMTELHAQQSLR